MEVGVNQNVQIQGNMQGTVGLRDTAKEAALLALMKETGYPIFQENGQRKYGPCPYWTGPTPSRGCEVFVGKLPRDCYEDELVPILSRVGTIYELRLMMEFSGSNRGFCFVTYTQTEDAKRAVRELNNFEIRRGKFLGVCQSVDNCRLFVGGLPREKKQDEILEELRGLADGVIKCIVYADARDKTKNRGFAFVEFESHRAAAMARRKLVGGGPVQLWGQQIAIDWAEPEVEIDEDIMSQVRILYIRNLMLDTSEEKIEMLCNQALKKADAIERVKKLRDYAFVHFKERNDAIAAMKELNGMEVDGATIEVVLAKPVDKKSPKKPSKPEHQPILGLPGLTYIPTGSLVTSPTPESLSGHASRELLGRNPLVMGTREGSKGRVRGAGGIGRIYSQTRSPYRKISTEGRSVGFYPGMEMIIASPFIFSPPMAQAKLPVQILEEICTINGWVQPVYQLFMKQEGPMDGPFYFCKLILPSIPDTLFQSNILSPGPEEAKQYVAQSALTELYKRGFISEGMIAAILNSAVAPLPAVLPTTPALPTPASAPILATPGVYGNPSLMPTSPPQFMLTNGSYGDLHSDFAPASSVLSVVTNPVYFMSGGKVPNGNTIPVVSSIPYASIPYATIPVPGYKF